MFNENFNLVHQEQGQEQNYQGENNQLKRKKIFFFFLATAILIASTAGVFYFYEKQDVEYIKPEYAQAYSLVNDKVSQSATIAIYLPKAIEHSIAQDNVKFEPEIDGEWINSDNEKQIIFKPKEKLKLNRYYSVELSVRQSLKTIIKADFLAVEDPEIIAIFPKENTEAPENSEITIIFNRPMVPLTTLGYLEEKDVPVEIAPETQGRFKWITTRNLQFIPDERLIRSSHYKVRIKQGFISMDNLAVNPIEKEFFTRKLRYVNLTAGKIVYNQPITIYFNQPVDLGKIRQQISLTDDTSNKKISFIAEYGFGENKLNKNEEQQRWGFGSVDFSKLTATITDAFGITWLGIGDDKNNEEKIINQSIIQIYNQKDRFDRGKFWDFKNNYTLKINKAYPSEGDIILDESRETRIFSADVIKDIFAESERTRYATPSFFDPQGKLWIDFYEEINLDKSKIKAEKSRDIGYGEKCKDENISISNSIECEKIPDKKRIYLIFQSEEIGLGEKLEINFEKIVNIDGLTINKDVIVKEIVSYPEFKIFRTFPSNNYSGAKLTELVICSNSPILSPDKQDFEEYFSASLDYEINYWGNSYRIERHHSRPICQIGEFETHISYGLTPLSHYSLQLKLQDVFSQKLNYDLKFTTGEMPSKELNFYHFQKRYNVTSPRKTKLTFAVKNMEYANLEICKLSALDFMRQLDSSSNYYYRYDLAPKMNCEKIVRDEIDLPERYWIKNYFNVDVKNYFHDTLGYYVLTFSHPNYKGRYWESKIKQDIYKQIYERTFVNITNLSVVEKKINSQYSGYGTQKILDSEQLDGLNNFYWITDITTLKPVVGARIALYQRNSDKGLIFVNTYTTNNQGIALTEAVHNLDSVIISNHRDSTIIPKWESRLDYVAQAFSAEKIYIYTDKPIYRPGQEVFLKAIHRIGYDGNYEVYTQKNLNLKIYNSRGDEIFNENLQVNDFGSLGAKIALDNSAPLGMYRACVETHSCAYFDVQEYVPSAFEVKIETDKDEYVSKDTVNLDINANYYFGVPVEGGEISYTISSQNYYMDKYEGEYFNFGSQRHYYQSYSFGDKFILRGKTEFDEQGKAEISQMFDFEKLFKDKDERKSKIIVVDATVKTSQGQSVSAQKTFIVHAGEIYVGLKTDKSFLGKNEKINVKIKTVDTQGEEISAKNVNLNIYKIDWIQSKRMGSDGGYNYKYEKKRELIKNYKFNTDKQGNFLQEISIGKEGSYEIEAEAKDKKGNLVFSLINVYVHGTGFVSIKPTKDTALDIEAEKINLDVHDTAEIIIKSPYKKAKALVSIERGEIFDYEIRDITGNLFSYEFHIKQEYIPNIFATVLLISADSGQPEVKFGKIEFKVNTSRKEINIEVKANKNIYLPGEQVVLDIAAKDFKGHPVSAEISLAVVDLSVLALKGNPKKNPLIFFYGGFPLTVSSSSNIKNILIETDIATKGGGGGADELSKKKRGVFKETAFWQGSVNTNEQGNARIKFTLPDNLTTWQTEALGITKDTKLGIDYIEFITKKELMIVPLKPRFIIPGDVFHIGAKIFNQTEKTQKLDITFESSSLVLKDDKQKKKATIKKGKTGTVYFQVQALKQFDKGEHKFVLSAETRSKDLKDTIEQTIHITKNDTYETTATANYTSDNLVKEYVFLPDNIDKEKGGVSVKASATLAVFLSDALNYLLQYPYGCSEQIASRLNAIAIIQKGLNLPNLADKFDLQKIRYKDREYSISEAVEIGLAELYNNQKYDGGFAYWRSARKSDFYLSLHIAETLNNLSLAGFDINQNSLDRATQYIEKEIKKGRWEHESENQYKNRLIATVYTLSNVEPLSKHPVLLRKIIEVSNDDLFIKEQISNAGLSYLAILLASADIREDLKDKIYNVLDNRIDIDSRGAFLEIDKNMMWRYYETPIKNTALYLKALSADKRDNAILDKILRWLLNSRAKDGAWGSTNNTITVIDAFTEFLKWKKETESNFTLDLSINDGDEESFDFNSDTILDQFEKEIPLKEMEFNKNNVIEFSKTNHNNLENNFYYDMALKYYLDIDRIPPRDEGFSITREFYGLDDKENKNPVLSAQVGDVLRAHIQITVPKSRNFVMIEDYIPAGMEIVNLDLATEQKSLRLQETELQGREFRPDFQEIRDDRVFLFKENLQPEVYEFDYFTRVLIKGRFNHLPAIVSEMYFPENFGRTDGRYFEIK